MFAASANQILAVVNASRIKYGIWWMCNMASGQTDPTRMESAGIFRFRNQSPGVPRVGCDP